MPHATGLTPTPSEPHPAERIRISIPVGIDHGAPTAESDPNAPPRNDPVGVAEGPRSDRSGRTLPCHATPASQFAPTCSPVKVVTVLSAVCPNLPKPIRRVVAAQPGIVAVPDLFGVVIGPSSLIVNGDVTFADDLTVPAVEQAIIGATAALRARWPSVDYVYLTPVHKGRSRRIARAPRTRIAATGRAHAAEQPAVVPPMTGRHDSS